MSDPATDLARRSPDALDKIVGTGDTRAMLEQIERNVRDVIDIARDRGFVTRFNNRDFFGFPAWSLLALTYGLVPFVEWTKPVEGGWEARAVVRTREGDVVSSAEAMCTRKESSRRSADDHTLRAMAQTRAMRNALRSCLGAALVMAGFDFADPEAPATREQVGMLHQLEREIGWTHDEGHAQAGEVTSYKELTREEASVLIDRWTSLRDQTQGGEAERPPREGTSTRQPSRPDPQSEPGDRTGEDGVPGGGDTDDAHDMGKVVAAPSDSPPEAPDPHAPATAEQWARAAQHGLTGGKAVKMARDRWGVKGQSEITREQLAALLEEMLG